MNPNTKKLLGALVAAALAIAGYYGLVSQQQASSIQTQADKTLGNAPATPQSAPPAQPGTAPSSTAAPSAPSASPAPAPQAPAMPR